MTATEPNFNFDVVVVGDGATGLLSALGLAKLGLRIAVCGAFASASPPVVKSRTAALLKPTIELLEKMDLWARLRPAATPIQAIRIIDDMGRWPKSPEVMFHAQELGQEYLGWNTANWDVNAVLLEAIKSDGRCTLLEQGFVEEIHVSEGQVVLKLKDGRTCTARLVVGADGRNSICRQAAGVSTDRRDLDQVAMTCVLRHSRSHRNISTEFHRPAGPFTTVPLAGNQSSLVWVEKPDVAQDIVSNSDETALHERIEGHLQGLLGSVASVAGQQMFPLSFQSTDRLVGPRIALVGEAAHVFPPIGAQGLNLGFRDVGTLIDVVSRASQFPDSLGLPEMLDEYDSLRQTDVQSRMKGVDLLNSMLISSIWPTHLARGAALHAFNAIPALKRHVMRLGMGGSRS